MRLAIYVLSIALTSWLVTSCGSDSTAPSPGLSDACTGPSCERADASARDVATEDTDGPQDASSDGEASTDVAPDAVQDAPDPADVPEPSSGTCAPLAPAPHIDPVEVVGDGTPSSCTEASLRTAVDRLNTGGGGTLSFDCGGSHTITLASALMIDTGDGTEPGQLVIDGGDEITISGGSTTRILDLDHYTDLVIQRIRLVDGYVADEADGDPPDSGAAIRHPWFGKLQVIDVHFENNVCESLEGEIGGGAIYAGGLSDAVISGSTFVANRASNGGGLLNRGTTLTLIDTVFQDNGALSVGDGQFGNGGGVYIDGMNYDDPGDLHVCGGIFVGNTAMTHGSGMFSFFYEGSSSTIEHSVFDGNRFGDPESGSGGLYHQAVHLDLRNTTLANHTTGQHAGGLFLGGGSSATVTNSTFANNRVIGNGAGVFNGASSMDIVGCTFTGNDADYGPAIFKGQDATVTLTNTIMADNTTANQFSATSCHAALGDGGGNIQWPATKASGSPDQPCVEGILFADPLLEPLADNGGAGQTAALSSGSPAIDLGGDTCTSTDQRGQPRVGPCDSGAYEFQP